LPFASFSAAPSRSIIGFDGGLAQNPRSLVKIVTSEITKPDGISTLANPNKLFLVLRCLVWVATALGVGFDVEFSDEEIDHGGKVSN
jgi:hypothetical protein